MPAFRRIDRSQNGEHFLASRTLQARADNSSEAAALPDGEKALTPIIAGTISGTCIGVAWLVALIVILVKRFRRKRRYKKVGQGGKLSAVEERRAAEFILPPDPAVLQGSHLPGERVIVPEKKKWWKGRRRAMSMSGSRGNGKEKAMPPRRRMSAPGPTRTLEHQDGAEVSLSGQNEIGNTDPNLIQKDVLVLLQPPFHRLSTIMSIADRQRSLDRTPPPPEPPNGEASQREDVKDFAPDDSLLSPAPSTGRIHTYPPSRVRNVSR